MISFSKFFLRYKYDVSNDEEYRSISNIIFIYVILIKTTDDCDRQRIEGYHHHIFSKYMYH